MRTLLAATLLIALAAPLRADDKPWEKPKDGVFTEKQVDAWIDYSEKLIKAKDEALKAIDKAKNDPAAAIAVSKELEAKEKKLQEASGLRSEELAWVGDEAMKIHMVWQVWTQSLKPDLDAKLKDEDDKLAAAQKAKADVAAARKSGRRIMTPEEKADAKKAADDQVKSCEDALKDAKQATADAKAALDEAKKGDDQDAIKEKEEALKAAKEAEKEPAQNLDVAKKRQKDPDLPLTDDEKAENARDLSEREKNADEEIKTRQANRDQIAKSTREFQEKNVDPELKKHPAKNVEIVKARRERIQAVFEGLLGGPKKDK